MLALDLGSNTLRVLEYDCVTGQSLCSYEKVVKTADGLAEHGLINEGAVARVIDTIEHAKKNFDFSQKIRAVTTEAVRRASNGVAVIEEIAEQTGVCFEIISGDEEAELTFLAVHHRLSVLRYPVDSFVLIDIGGGSTEILFHYGQEKFSQSFPVGIVTIAQTYGNLDKIEAALSYEMQGMQQFAQAIYQMHGRVNTFVATAGTPTTVAAMKLGMDYQSYDAQRINGTNLMVDELAIYLRELLAYPFEERERMVGTGRSDLIAAGILIYQALYRVLEFDCCVVVDDGLREGVALRSCLEEAQ